MITELRCCGADDVVRVFYVEMPDEHEFPMPVRVRRQPNPDPSDDWFSLKVDRFRDGLILVKMNHNAKEWYSKKGIGDALIPELWRRTGQRIYSSSNSHPERDNEFRSVPAGKVWLRLLTREFADYLADEDRFTLPPRENKREDASDRAAKLDPAVSRRLVAFPPLEPVSVKRSRFLPILNDEFHSPKDVQALMLHLYDDPDCDTYIYFVPPNLNDLVVAAEQNGHISCDEVTSYYYKHPAHKLDFMQILPEELTLSGTERWRRVVTMWKQAIVAVGPMYRRVQVRLTPRMRRQMEMEHAARVQRELDRNPLQLRPGIWGFSVDLPKLWRLMTWLRRHNRHD